MLSDQYGFTAPFEGVVPHLYKDSRGRVTAGVGFLLHSEDEASRLGFEPAGALPADWARIAQAPANRRPGYYRELVTSRLSDEAMRAEFSRRVGQFEAELARRWAAWPDFPREVKVALLDMAYNLGAHGLFRSFPLLCAAVDEQCWARAAQECGRPGRGRNLGLRNAAVRKLFLDAVAANRT